MSKTTDRLEQISQQIVPSLQTQDARALLLSLINRCLKTERHDEAARHALSLFLAPPKHKTKPDALQVIQLATQSKIEIDGHNVVLYTWEPPTPISQGIAILTIFLSHGFGFSVATFTPLIVQLLASTSRCRILAVDHVGHGASSGSAADLGSMIRTIEKIVLDNKPLSAIVAHSVGGSATIMALAERPDILPSGAKLVLISPPMQPVTVMRTFCKACRLPSSLIPAMDGAMSPSLNQILRESLGERLSGLEILLINDKDENIAPVSDTMILLENLSKNCNVRFELTIGLDHTQTVENKSVVAKISDFLAEKVKQES